MHSVLRQVLAILLSCFFAMASAADLPIALVEESSLPYSFSPNNYDNSPNNYDNSINNYDNSTNNYDNSENNYENSSSNFDNSRSGERRLIYKEGGTPKFAGYYVSIKGGVTNFFSPKGKRMFYNPKKGSAVFGGTDGTFCGVLAKVNGVFSLALTDRGLKIFMLTQ